MNRATNQPRWILTRLLAAIGIDPFEISGECREPPRGGSIFHLSGTTESPSRGGSYFGGDEP